jgi:hypothetical protein
MKITIKGGLPYVTAQLTYRGRKIFFENVLVDTGSGGSVFQADRVLDEALHIEPTDRIREIRGVGGSEFVVSKRIDQLRLGDFCVDDFEIEVGAMGYGFEIEGIVGMDFLLQVGAVVDLDQLVITSSRQAE